MNAACGNSNPHGGHFDYARRRPCVGNIGRPIVAMTELPHYPSSAELAAFRRSIDVEHGSLGWRALASARLHPLSAFPDEREHGIGYRPSVVAPILDPGHLCYISARRMAAAQRTAAYGAASYLATTDRPNRARFQERMFGAPAVWNSTTSDL